MAAPIVGNAMYRDAVECAVLHFERTSDNRRPGCTLLFGANIPAAPFKPNHKPYQNEEKAS